MTTTDLARANHNSTLNAETLEKVVVQGDLKNLAPAERVQYYSGLCRSLGLNPLTKPFEYITLNGKLTLYAKRDCTDQLRAIHHVSVTITSREVMNGVYVVTAKSIHPDGRTDESIGAVSIENLKGEALANAYMKAETKAKRRVTLSSVGLGFLDETEIETIPTARVTPVDYDTGEVIDAPTKAPERPRETARPVPKGVPADWLTECPLHGAEWEDGQFGHEHQAPDGSCKRQNAIYEASKVRIAAASKALGWAKNDVLELSRSNFSDRPPSALNSEEMVRLVELIEAEAARQ